MKPAELVVRRNRLATAVGAVGALVFVLATSWFAFHAWSIGESLLAPGFILALALFYAAQAVERLVRDRPVLAIRPDGLHLPAFADAPVPWERIRALSPAGGFAAWRGGRVDLALDAETFARIRPGQRFLGDPVTRLRGGPNAIAIHTRGLDHDAATIVAALHRYWPPRSDADEG